MHSIPMKVGAVNAPNRVYGSKAELAQRRAEIAATIIPMYRAGKGFKVIARETGYSPRIVRVVLIEAGAWMPKRPGKKDAAAPYSRHGAGRPRACAMRSAFLSEQKAVAQWEARYERAYRVVARKTKKWASWMDQYRNDPHLKTAHLLRKRVRNMIQRGTESVETIILIGCSREQFMAHIEAQFTEGMHWNNQGVGKGKWNIDHIKPIRAFDLSDPAQQRACFHWSNSQPLWAVDNIRKSDKVDGGAARSIAR